MAVIPEHLKPAFISLLQRVEVGVALPPDLQRLIFQISWVEFVEEYGIDLVDTYMGRPVTFEVILALSIDLGIAGTLSVPNVNPEEDLWL